MIENILILSIIIPLWIMLLLFLFTQDDVTASMIIKQAIYKRELLKKISKSIEKRMKGKVIKTEEHKHNISKGKMKILRDKDQEYTFTSFKNMHGRCNGKTEKSIKNYVSKNISVCKRWSFTTEGFRNFVIDMGLRPNKLTIDRIDNDGNYEPSNCRWTTYRVNNSNRNLDALYKNAGIALSKTLKDPDIRDSMSRRTKELWQNEDYHNKQSLSRSKQALSSGRNKGQNNPMSKTWRDKRKNSTCQKEF